MCLDQACDAGNNIIRGTLELSARNIALLGVPAAPWACACLRVASDSSGFGPLPAAAEELAIEMGCHAQHVFTGDSAKPCQTWLQSAMEIPAVTTDMARRTCGDGCVGRATLPWRP